MPEHFGVINGSTALLLVVWALCIGAVLESGVVNIREAIATLRRMQRGE